MKLENINEIITEATKKSYHKLLFDFKMGDIVFKCLLLVNIRVLIMSIKNNSIGFSMPFDEYGNISGKLPSEIYYYIVEELKRIYHDNKVNIMWKDFDKYLLELNLEKISKVNNSDIIGIIKNIKTKDEKYDDEGEKPYFETWIRHKVNGYSPMNHEKTARYFGYDIAKLASKQNISSRWKGTIQVKSLDFLDPKKVENDILKLK